MHPDDRKNAACLAAHLSSGNWYDGLVSIRGVVLQLAPYQLIKADDIGIVARAIYGNFGSLPLDKMSTGLSELGYAWSHSILTEVELAIKKVIF